MMGTVMLIIGHRGAAGLAPENSLESLHAAVDAGADILEFDVRLTKDGVLVLVHDMTTLRTHHKRVTVKNATLDELRTLVPEPRIVTLNEVLDEFFGHIMLNIELKGKGTGEAVTHLLKERYVRHHKDWDAVFLSSFKGRELIAARRASKHVNLACLHDQNPFIFIAYHRPLRLTAVGFHRLYLNSFALEIARRAGLFTYAYTVDRPRAAWLLKRKGIDGIVTNRPDAILREIKQRA